MSGKEISGYCAIVFTIVMKLPQLYKTLKTKKAQDLSIWFLLFSVCGHISWLTYGIFDNMNMPLVITDITCLILTFVIMSLKVYYDKKDTQVNPVTS